MVNIEIRPLTSLNEIKQIEEIQRTTWNMADLDIVPAHMFHAAQHSGAALIGAFDGEQLVGFVFGILGTVESLKTRVDPVAAARLKMYSVIAGVLPEYQKDGIGHRLKLAQRDFARKIGIRLITWTFDPLESLNARFNIGKLGCVCHNYIRDYHGKMGGINAGLPTDRFEVEWWVTGNRVERRDRQPWRPLSLAALLGGGAVLVNEATFNRDDLPVPPPNYVSRPGNLMLVEIPSNFQAIKRQDIELATRWREHTRHIFEQLFDSGYIVTDFVSYENDNGRRQSYYLLAHQDG